MRFKSAVLSSAVALALAAGAAPALAADGATHDFSTVKDGVRLLLPPLPCPAGEKAVWVDRAGSLPRLFIDPFTGQLTWTPAVVEFHGWECHPMALVPVGP